jgi:hypothetical protein
MAEVQIDRQKFAALVLIEFPERQDGFQQWDA